MLRQLTSLDAQFLALETPRQAGHVAGLAILDPSTAPGGTLTLADLQRLLAERLPQLPPLRWRLAEVPLGLDYPYWVDDADFDLEYHVRELGLPAPGTDAQLAEQVARITSRPLDRARPLWELYLIHGLQSGHTAMLTKIHHAVVDGLSGAEIMGLLLDLSPEGREVPPPIAGDGAGAGDDGAEEPGQLGMLTRGLLGIPRYPLRVLRALPSTLPYVDDARGTFGTHPRHGHGEPRGRLRPGPRAPRRRGGAGAAAHRAADAVQRADLPAPPLRLRPARPRRGQGGQEPPRLHRQRRRRLDLRRRGAPVARRAPRAAGRPARGPDPGLGPHRRRDGHLRQPHPAHGARSSSPTSPTPSCACTAPTRRCRS